MDALDFLLTVEKELHECLQTVRMATCECRNGSIDGHFVVYHPGPDSFSVNIWVDSLNIFVTVTTYTGDLKHCPWIVQKEDAAIVARKIMRIVNWDFNLEAINVSRN